MVMATTSPSTSRAMPHSTVAATPISGINNLTSLGGVATNGTITTTGAQSFEGNATLIGNTTLVGPSATLAGTFDGQGHTTSPSTTRPQPQSQVLVAT